MSYGHQWVFKDFYKSFKHVIDVYANMRREANRAEKTVFSTFTQSIYAWNQSIKAKTLPKTGYQMRFPRSIGGGNRKYPIYAYVKTIEKINGREKEVLRCKNPDKYTLRYTKNSYEWFKDDDNNRTIKGKQICFPKGKILVSCAMHPIKTIQLEL